MRLLSVRDHRGGEGFAGPQPGPEPGGDRRRAGQPSVSLRRASANPARGRQGGGDDPRRRRAMSDSLPLSIQNNRRMEKWIRFDSDRTVRLAVGKVELGQGNVTALAQIAAEELDVDLARIAVLSGDTEDAPDEGQTTSSQSIEVSGRSVRLVTAELRARVLDRLARRLNCAPAEISVEDGVFHHGDAPTEHDYWNFVTADDFSPEIAGTATPKPHTAYRVVGKPVQRRDLPAKVSGPGFIHDMVRPDMLHARTLRQPNRGAVLATFNEAPVRHAAGGDFRV